MNEEQLNKFYEQLKEYFGESLPDLDHEPIRFAYYVKLYLYCNGKQ